MVYRHYGDASDVYGVAGHGDRQRGVAAYRGRTGGQRGRKHVGADELSGFERGGAAAFGMAEPAVWAKTLLHDLRGVVHSEFVVVWIRAKPGSADFLPGAARNWRGRPGSGGAGDFGGYVSGEQAG